MQSHLYSPARRWALLLLISWCLAAAGTAAGLHIIHLSDLHYDPLFGSPQAVGPCKNSTVPFYGVPGCDSSQEQVARLLQDVAAVAETLDDVMVLYTGDWLRHDMASLPEPHRLGAEIMDTLAGLINSTLGQVSVSGKRVLLVPHVHVPFNLGNEDFIPDYHFNVSSSNHSMLHHYSESFLRYELMSKQEAAAFRHCGFYSRNITVGASPLRVLSLNTLVWDRDISPSTKGMSDPCGQFSWLAAELASASAAGQRVIVQSHIPPSFWQPEFVAQYTKLMHKHRAVVAVQFYGHIHRVSYLAMSHDDHVSPLFIGGPLTRVSHTNPCYQVMLVDNQTAEVQQLQQRLLDPTGNWTWGRTLPAYYNMSNLTTASLYNFAWGMRHFDAAARAAFVAWYTVFNGGIVSQEKIAGCDVLCQRTYACLLVVDTLAGAIGCELAGPNRSPMFLEAAQTRRRLWP